MFCVFGLLSFFPVVYTVCFGVFVLKRLTILSLKPSTIFLIDLGIQLINQSYQVFLIGLIFFITFCSILTISSIDTRIGLKKVHLFIF